MSGVAPQPVSGGSSMKGITEKPVAAAHRAQRRDYARQQLQDLRANWNKPSRKSITRSGGRYTLITVVCGNVHNVKRVFGPGLLLADDCG